MLKQLIGPLLAPRYTDVVFASIADLLKAWDKEPTTRCYRSGVEDDVGSGMGADSSIQR
jgi:hypothetical protein